jgi:hypothetical protein
MAKVSAENATRSNAERALAAHDREVAANESSSNDGDEAMGQPADPGEEPPDDLDKDTRSASDESIRLGQHKSDAKWARQLEKRGWTKESIHEAVKNGKSYPAENKVNLGNSATRYVHPKTGKSVVIDDVTKEVIQIGAKNFQY